MELAREVRLDVLAPLLLRKALRTVDRVDHARVGDDRVAAAESLDQARDGGLCRSAISHVEPRACRDSLVRRKGRLDVGRHVAGPNLAIAFSEGADDRTPDAASRAGHEHTPSVRRGTQRHQVTGGFSSP